MAAEYLRTSENFNTSLESSPGEPVTVDCRTGIRTNGLPYLRKKDAPAITNSPAFPAVTIEKEKYEVF